MEIFELLCDMGQLFENVPNLKIASQTFIQIAEVKLSMT